MNDMEKYYLGIDIGTSSVKLVAAAENGDRISAKAAYRGSGTEEWLGAMKRAFSELGAAMPLSRIAAAAVSSQVGTYITDRGDVIPWYSDAGRAELDEIKAEVDDETFVKETGMRHPDLISYPLPRLLCVKRSFPEVKSVVMPKEAVIAELTGTVVTDFFSWRGICHPDSGRYSEKLMREFGIDLKLPKAVSPTSVAGRVTRKAAEEYGLSEGIPIYAGCNDFYAGLLGMGVFRTGTVFELSGTSEHIGVVTETAAEGRLISGRYFNGFATYGGTKSSGRACDFAIRNFGADGLGEDEKPDGRPIFLPYLNGERAPIYDENARGVFFGIGDRTTKADMAYAVLEGVVFSLYHIYEGLPATDSESIVTGGGSSGNRLMAKLKAELFGRRIIHTDENEASAFGAALIAMTADGAFGTLGEAAERMVKYGREIVSDGSMRKTLLRRFEIYKGLYSDLKKSFGELENGN